MLIVCLIFIRPFLVADGFDYQLITKWDAALTLTQCRDKCTSVCVVIQPRTAEMSPEQRGIPSMVIHNNNNNIILYWPVCP